MTDTPEVRRLLDELGQRRIENLALQARVNELETLLATSNQTRRRLAQLLREHNATSARRAGACG